MKKIVYPLHERLGKFQQENGLRHRDYLTYHRFCTKQLRKLRRKLELTHMNKNRKLRTQFEYSKVTMEEITTKGNPAHLYFDLLLIDSERAWTRANELKQEYHENKEENSRLRIHYLHRFRKAALVLSKKIHELMDQNKDKFDELTIVEGEVYHQYLLGIYLMEKEDFRKALTSFEVCQKIYTTLSKNEEERLSVREEYLKKVSLIQDYVRLCKLWIEEEDEDESEGEEEDEEDKKEAGQKKEVKNLDIRLRTILEVRRKTAKREGAISKIRFLGRDVSIEGNDRVRQLFHQSYNMGKELTSLREEQESKIGTDLTVPGGLIPLSSLKIMLSLYDRILGSYRDLQISVREELRNQEKYEKSKTSVQHLRWLHTFLEYKALEDTQERNELLVSQYTNQTLSKLKTFSLQISSSILDVHDSGTHRKKSIEARNSEDILRLYEMMMQSFSDMKELEGVSVFSPITIFLTCRTKVCHCLKCFYQSRAYFDKNRFRESYGLLKRSEELYEEYKKEYEKSVKSLESEPTDEELVVLIKKMKSDRAKLSVFVENRYRIEKARIHSTNYLFEQSENQKREDKDIQMKRNKRMKNIGKLTVLDTLEEYKETKKKNPFLVHFPPTYQPIGPKPLFFDIAQDHIPEFPNLAKKLEKKEKKSGGGWFGGFFG